VPGGAAPIRSSGEVPQPGPPALALFVCFLRRRQFPSVRVDDLAQDRRHPGLEYSDRSSSVSSSWRNAAISSLCATLSRVLDVPVSFFFDDMDPVRAPAIPAGFAEPAAEPFDSNPLRRRETVELVSAYYRIADPGLRRRLFELARALAGGA